MEKDPKGLQVFSYGFGPYRLEVAEQRLLRDGHVVPLTPKVFDLLCLLVRHNGHLLTKEHLLEAIWGEVFVEEANLNRAVSVLRKALGERLGGQKYVETVAKRGYRFVAPVTEITAADPVVPGSNTRVKPMAAVAAALVAAALIYASVAFVRRPAAPVAPAPEHRQMTFTGTESGSPTFSPDGARVAYVSQDTPERTLKVHEMAAGRSIGVFSAPEVARPRWSPDGSMLMIWTRGEGRDGIYVMPRMGGIAREIARNRYVACWSPDGSTIAVAHYLSPVIVFVDVRTREQRPIPLEGQHRWIWDIDWSPVDDRLAFASSDDQGWYSVWTIRPDGTDQRLELRAHAEIVSVRWAPGGRTLYYFQRANQTVSLGKIDAGRRSPGAALASAALLTGLEAEGSFAVSPDGRSLVYARASVYSNLWTVRRDSADPSGSVVTTAVTRGTSLIERPRVSPDGNRIAFNMGRGSQANLYVMPVTGGSPRQLTFLEAFNIGAAWSPDGGSIAFASTADGRPRVWIVPSEGGVPQPVSTGDFSADNLELAWSPGAEILYQQTGNRNFYRLDPRTGRERLLVRDSSVGWLFSPVHAPSDRILAVAWNRHPGRGVWIVDEDTSHEQLLYESAPPPVLIGWSADGESIFTLDGRPNYRGLVADRGETLTEARVLKVSARDGAVQAVVALPFGEVGGVSMTPDGRTLVVTVYSSTSDVWRIDHFDPDIERGAAGVPPGPSTRVSKVGEPGDGLRY